MTEAPPPYDNCLSTVEDYHKSVQQPKPQPKPDFPFRLKVDIWRAGEAQLFARTGVRREYINRGRLQVRRELIGEACGL